MGRKIITEVVTLSPKRVYAAVMTALGRPYYYGFRVEQRRIERTPPKVKHGNA